MCLVCIYVYVNICVHAYENVLCIYAYTNIYAQIYMFKYIYIYYVYECLYVCTEMYT